MAYCSCYDGFYPYREGCSQVSISYLELFPRGKRLMVWSKLGCRPQWGQVLMMIGGFSAASQVVLPIYLTKTVEGVDVSVWNGSGVPQGLHVSRVTECQPEWLGCDLTVPAVSGEAYRDGYCYLPSMLTGEEGSFAAIFGPNPPVEDIRPFLKVSARANLIGQQAHLQSDGLLPVMSVADGVVVGAENMCYNCGDAKEICRSCRTTSQVPEVEVDGPIDKVTQELRSAATIGLSPEHRTDQDVLYVVAGTPLRPPIGRDVSRLVGLQRGRCSTPDRCWAVWLDTGESVDVAGARFAPTAFRGGLLMGCGSMDLVYCGPRQSLLIRAYCVPSWVKMAHTRLGVGVTSSVLTGQDGCPSFVFAPGGAARSKSRLWRMAQYPTDHVCGRVVEVGFNAYRFVMKAGDPRCLPLGAGELSVCSTGASQCYKDSVFQTGPHNVVHLVGPPESYVDVGLSDVRGGNANITVSFALAAVSPVAKMVKRVLTQRLAPDDGRGAELCQPSAVSFSRPKQRSVMAQRREADLGSGFGL